MCYAHKACKKYEGRQGTNTAHKMKFSIVDFFSKCDQIHSFLNGKLHFLYSVTLVSLINEVSQFFLKPNKQDGGINKKGLIMKNVQNTVQKMKFSIKDFFSKCDQIRSFLRIWSHLLKKSLMENFFFCAV